MALDLPPHVTVPKRRGWLRRLGPLALLAGVAVILSPASARGAVTCTATWDHGGGSDLWSNAANWSGDVLPGASDVVCIPTLAGAAKVNFDATVPVPNRTIDTLDAQVEVDLTGGTLTISSGVSNSTSGTVSDFRQSGGILDGSGQLTVPNGGTYAWTGGDINGSGAPRWPRADRGTSRGPPAGACGSRCWCPGRPRTP